MKVTVGPPAAPGIRSTAPSVGRDDVEPGRAARDVRSTGSPGATAAVGAAEPPSSSPVEVGEEDREGHLERQVGLARLEGEDGGRQPGPDAGVEEGRALRARDDGPRPGRQVSCWAAAMWVVERST